ncbi:sulfite exporter TauE/SafE family protein [Nocardia terpenica]|uniref:Probable membrane transporter protein n=1 Tax=Nocardia terpenica TaxID=455432 RepID=A0A291RMJ5_9NOCA|nr:sulfite exporter TauE/SafE family protein [Nocardia terpenica]ATL68384.1 permease [Nocardia terpenica]
MFSSLAILFGFGCLTGVTTVLFGFGGGFLTVPAVFAVVAATDGTDAMHTAVATSTAVMVVNALSATVAQARAGRLRREYVFPLALFVGIGAFLGAVAAGHVSDTALHLLFIGYLVITLADNVIRRGFVTGTDPAAAPRPLGRVTSTVSGVGIGAVAAFLGVGGSVLTVPLLRRSGLPMAEAAALANPLSVPVALVGTLAYALAAPPITAPGYLGQVDLVAAAALLCGSVPTIALTRRLPRRIPDRVHAIGYLGFLGLVLIAMVVMVFIRI